MSFYEELVMQTQMNYFGYGNCNFIHETTLQKINLLL